MGKINNKGGLVQLIVIVIVVILILSYFGFDLRGFFDNPQTQDNFAVVWNFVVRVWNDYLETPARWVWENIIWFFWNDLFLENLDRLRGGEGFREVGPDTPELE